MHVTRSYYRRPLPPSCVSFSSAAGRELFKEALAAGGAEGYWRLAEVYHTQSDPAFCGLASLAMVLNALAIDPGRVWRGAWRWFDESLLDCCVPLDVVARDGIVLDALACLARCNGAAVRARRAPPADGTPAAHSSGLQTCTFDEFEADVRAACFEESPHSCVVVSYSRHALGQTGGGHYSPVGAFAPASRMVLVFDVARFKYPPHWVHVDELWAAMRAIDPATDLPRGYMRLSAAQGAAPVGVYMTLSRRIGMQCACNGNANAADALPGWLAFLTGRDGALPEALAAAGGDDADAAGALRHVARRLLRAISALPDVSTVVERYDSPGQGADAAAAAARAAVIDDVRATALHAALYDAMAEEQATQQDAVALTLLLAAAPDVVWQRTSPAVRAAARLRPGGAADEVVHLATQLAALMLPGACCNSQEGGTCTPSAVA